MKSGKFNFLEHCGSFQACNGTALPLHNLERIYNSCFYVIVSIGVYVTTPSLNSFWKNEAICLQVNQCAYNGTMRRATIVVLGKQ